MGAERHARRTRSSSTLTSALLRWFATARRPLPWRQDPTPYSIWVAEVLLQQTQHRAGGSLLSKFYAALSDAVCTRPRLRAAGAQSLGRGWLLRSSEALASGRPTNRRRTGGCDARDRRRTSFTARVGTLHRERDREPRLPSTGPGLGSERDSRGRPPHPRTGGRSKVPRSRPPGDRTHKAPAPRSIRRSSTKP